MLAPSTHGFLFVSARTDAQDDTFDDSSLFSAGSSGSASVAGYRRRNDGTFPPSPSVGALDRQSSEDDFEDDDDDLQGRWGTGKAIISSGIGGGGDGSGRGGEGGGDDGVAHGNASRNSQAHHVRPASSASSLSCRARNCSSLSRALLVTDTHSYTSGDKGGLRPYSASAL